MKEEGRRERRWVRGKHGGDVYSGGERLRSSLGILADSMIVFHVDRHG